jgi:hypothetical protein
MVFDFVCLHNFEANNRSSSSFSEGELFVAVVSMSRESVILSLNWTKAPFRQVLVVVCGNSIYF